MKRCVFCAIIARQAPASIVYEDEHILSFMNIRRTLVFTDYSAAPSVSAALNSPPHQTY